MRVSASLIAICGAGLVGSVASAEKPVGPQILIDYGQYDRGLALSDGPSVAASANGDFVVAWSAFPSDSEDSFVEAQRFDARGRRLGQVMRLDPCECGNEGGVGLAPVGDGAFVAVWDRSDPDTGQDLVHARRFNARGRAQGGAFRVGTGPPGSESGSNVSPPAIASNSSGRFVIAWVRTVEDRDSVYARAFDRMGVALGPEILVSGKLSAGFPSVGIGPRGAFVVVWETRDVASGASAIFARRFDSRGVPLGDEEEVSNRPAVDQSYPQVAVDRHQGFLVVWTDAEADEFQSGAGSEDRVGVVARYFAADGSGSAEPIHVNEPALGRQVASGVATSLSGGFVALWKDDSGSPEPQDIRIRAVDPVHGLIGPGLRVNPFPVGGSWSSIGLAATGRGVVAWSRGTDATGTSIDLLVRRLVPRLSERARLPD